MGSIGIKSFGKVWVLSVGKYELNILLNDIVISLINEVMCRCSYANGCRPQDFYIHMHYNSLRIGFKLILVMERDCIKAENVQYQFSSNFSFYTKFFKEK